MYKNRVFGTAKCVLFIEAESPFKVLQLEEFHCVSVNDIKEQLSTKIHSAMEPHFLSLSGLDLERGMSVLTQKPSPVLFQKLPPLAKVIPPSVFPLTHSLHTHSFVHLPTYPLSHSLTCTHTHKMDKMDKCKELPHWVTPPQPKAGARVLHVLQGTLGQH